MSPHILVAFALFVGSVLTIPVAEQPKATVDITIHVPSEKQANTNSKLRQDGEDGAEEVAEGLEAVAGPVAEIITGTLTGNFGQLFKGVTGTVTDQEAQPGVGTILQGVALPLQALWSQGIQAGQKYFNISSSTAAPAKGSVAAGSPVIQQLQPGQTLQINPATGNIITPQIIPIQSQVLPQIQVQQAVTVPTAEPKPTTEDDDEEDSEADNNSKL